MYRLQTSVPDDMGAAIEHIHATTGMTVSNIVRAALAEYVREHAPKKDGKAPDKPAFTPLDASRVRVKPDGTKEYLVQTTIRNEDGTVRAVTDSWMPWSELGEKYKANLTHHGLQP